MYMYVCMLYTIGYREKENNNASRVSQLLRVYNIYTIKVNNNNVADGAG